MKAVVIHTHGSPDVLSYEDFPTPRIKSNEVLIQVKSIALNHLDLWVRSGVTSKKLAMPHILGSDASGVVCEIGTDVEGLKIGDKVILAPGYSLCNKCKACLAGDDNLCADYHVLGESISGVYAEFVKIPANNVFQIPAGLSFEQAAAIPLVFLTAWNMLVNQVKIKRGETVLIHAAGSGVGSAGIQIAKLFGAMVIATASSDEKLRKAIELGADHIIRYDEKNFRKETRAITSGQGVDIVFEHVGEETWVDSIRALATGGRLVTCGATSGYLAETDLRHVFFRSLKIYGNFMGRKGGLLEALQFFPEKLKPMIDKSFHLSEVAAAHKYLADRRQFGKIILNI